MSGNILNERVNMGYTEHALETDIEEFRKVIDSRRSIRIFKNEPIPEDVVKDCLRMALKAPNSSNLQTWEFYRIKSPETKKLMVKACLDQAAAATAAELIVITVNLTSWRRNAKMMLEMFEAENKNYKVPASAILYYKKIVPFVYTMGFLSWFGFIKKIIIFFSALFRPTPREQTSWNDLKIWAIKSAALACENLMLAFRAYGYDTCPMEGYDSLMIKKLLKLSRKHEVVMVVAAGKRDPTKVYGPQVRFDEKLFLFEV